MVYGYIRVSTDLQTVENQRFEITNFTEKQNLKIDGWIDETISGTFAYDKRKLGTLLKKVKKGDIIICSEISRLGRNLFMIMEILHKCMKKGCQVWTIKDGYRLGDDIQSKVLAFAFGLSAEIERNLISQRTKEALKRKRAEGVVLGRPLGRLSNKTKLTGKEKEIKFLRDIGTSWTEIAKKFKVSRNTLDKFRRRMGWNIEFDKSPHNKVWVHKEEIEQLLAEGISQREISKKFNISFPNLSNFINYNLGRGYVKNVI